MAVSGVSQTHFPAKQSHWHKLFEKQSFKVSGYCSRNIEQINIYSRKLWKNCESVALESVPTFSPAQHDRISTLVRCGAENRDVFTLSSQLKDSISQ